jgi:hypothetical protein
MTKDKIKLIIIGLGILDIVSFYRSYKFGLDLLSLGPWTSSDLNNASDIIFFLTVVLNLTLIFSLIASGLLSYFRPKTSILIYYFQFPLRLLFMTLTFGFIIRLLGIEIGTLTHKIVVGLIIGLELLRLIFSIKTRKIDFQTI